MNETANDRYAPRVLTDPFIKALKPAPAGQRYAVADALVPGLKVRVTDKGSKSFVLWRRYGGAPNPAARSLGKVGAITLAQARDKARGWLELVSKGEDPAALERARREVEKEKRDNTFGAVFEDFLKRHVKGQRKAGQVEREMRKDLLPFWRDKPVTAITHQNIRRLIEGIVDRGAPRQAHSVLTHCKTFFGWVVERGVYGIELSPAAAIKPKILIGEKNVRQRVLTDNEIAAFWRATGRMSYPAGPLFRMLLLTGQRKNEIGHARWREFDLNQKLLTVPPERFKSDSTHMVPLSDDAVALLETLPRWNAGDFLFSTTGGVKPVRDLDTPKKKLDRHMLRILQAMARRRGDDPATVELPPFVLHDLRRSMRTRLAELRIPDPVSEMVIGHGKKGLARIYDQHKYINEMREALEAWAAKVRTIVEPPTKDNVVDFPQAAS
jgi:integrase